MIRINVYTCHVGGFAKLLSLPMNRCYTSMGRLRRMKTAIIYSRLVSTRNSPLKIDLTETAKR